MRLYSLALISTAGPFEEEASILTLMVDVPMLYLSKKKVLKDTCRFLSRNLGTYCRPGTRMSTEKERQRIYIDKHPSQIGAVVIADEEYPPRLMHSLAREAIEATLRTFPDFHTLPKDPNITVSDLKRLFSTYQSPKNFDKLQKLNEEVEQTIRVANECFQNILIRGQKLEDLVMKSEDLEAKSKIFYKESKRCCTLL